MRNALIIAAIATVLGMASPAAAETLTTTTSTLACEASECTTFATSVAALKPFDSSLGTLTGITLDVDASTATSYTLGFTNGQFTQQSGTAELSYQSLFDVLLNGVTYSFNVSGAHSISYTGFPTFTPSTFAATGSGTFVLDPSLFASFVDVSNLCNIFQSPSSGVCVSGDTEVVPTLGNIVASSNNLTFALATPPPAITRSAEYSLTYTYTPAVPEPATWAMMLLGFGMVGFAARRQRRLAPVA